ncbi:asparagine synthase (glutamine-hydrolyzing) [Phnomibacter sp. MR]|uniref:asparagine synthase (glutamine-hydrolyzing) n=1 Tax=Phnomibacter sp. MR TaxID=3042318 RepID=UPI003A7FE6FC
MCRIAGIIDFTQPENCHRITAMRDSMLHGGPDDAGIFHAPAAPLSFGVRRLSLLDLSMQGHQPMQTADGRYSIAFNGELYNFANIRRELQQAGHIFHSGTDTEVALKAYVHWGLDCFKHFNGMFALAVYDQTANTLTLARDHAGMKPLYYYFNAQQRQCYFGSEVRSFHQVRPGWPEDEHWRIRFLAYGHMPEPYTTLKDVFSLPRGHYMHIQLDSFQQHTQAWHQPYNGPALLHGAAANDALHQSIEAAVKDHMIADAPIGVFLSGGIDSSIITTMAARHHTQPIVTLSLDFEDAKYSEKEYQQIIARQCGTTHHAFTIGEAQFQEQLPDILKALDQPSNDGINAYFICKYARQIGLKAVLSGIGGDELFGGYPSFKRQRWVKPLQTLGPLLGLGNWSAKDWIKRFSYLRHSSDAAQYLFHRGYFNSSQISMLTGSSLQQVNDVLQLQQPAAMLRQNNPAQVSSMEQHFYLQNQLLRDTDVMSMWHSVEVRIPFLDKRVLQVCEQTDNRTRFNTGQPKQWLIQTFANDLPEAIWNRKKMGFAFPFGKWMQPLSVRGAVHPELPHFEKQFENGHMQWSRYWAYLLSTRLPIQIGKPKQRILFASLRTFSAMGGIEKFNRAYGLALQHNALQHNWQVAHTSLYDAQPDARYFPAQAFMGFRQHKWEFVWYFLRHHRHFDTHILGHINLSICFAITKWFSKAQRIMLTHGIEVWSKPSTLQRVALHSCSNIWTVSAFSKTKLKETNGPSLPGVHIFHNTLDPFFEQETAQLDKVALPAPFPAGYLLTIARLADSEAYKGYDKVIAVLPKLLQQYPNIQYVLGGSGSKHELQRIHQLIQSLGLEKHVTLTGFIPDEALPAYYQHAAAFIMPSRKEGFGIVFVEAAWCGTRVIAGNADGSPEALLQGQLGLLVDPQSEESILQAIETVLQQPPLSQEAQQQQRQLVATHFSFARFQQHQAQLLQQKAQT